VSAARGAAQIVVDNIYVRPSKLTGTISERVLKPLTFQVVLNLAGR
jgi:hypothetical protein